MRGLNYQKRRSMGWKEFFFQVGELVRKIQSGGTKIINQLNFIWSIRKNKIRWKQSRFISNFHLSIHVVSMTGIPV